MSRRETFLESARAANDLALESTPQVARPREAVTSPDLETGLREILGAIGRLEARPTSAEPERRRQRETWRALALLLAGGLVALLLLTSIRPEWALREKQRAELELGRRMHQLLDTMEETEREQVLGSLWATSDTSPTTD